MKRRAILDVTPANAIREMSFGDKKRQRTQTTGTSEPDIVKCKPPRTRKSVAGRSTSPKKSASHQPTGTPKNSAPRQTTGTASNGESTPQRGDAPLGRRPTRAILAAKCQQLQEENSSLRQHLGDTQRLLEENEKESRCYREKLASREREISESLADTERELSRASNDLINVRSFSEDSAPDVPRFLTSFDDINDDVIDFARCLVRKLTLGDDIIEDIDLEALARKNKAIYSYLASLLLSAEKWSCRLEQTLMLAVRALFAVTLQDAIFSPFAPGVETEYDNVLKKVEQAVQSQEPQLYYARWRAMTYKSAITSRRDNFLKHEVDKFVDRLAQLLSVFCDEPHTALKSLYGTAHQIFTMAVEWQDQARTAHLAFDYCPLFTSPDVAFCPEKMERQPLPPERNSKNAVGGRYLVHGSLLLTLGLEAKRSCLEFGKLVRPGRIVRRVKVL